MTSRTKWAKSLLGAAVIIGNCFWSFTASAEVSSAELKKVEKEVLAQSLEHQKLQAQANKIKQEIASINREMIKAAGQIQNSEVRLSQMEKQLETLKTELVEAQNGFSKEDDHLIKTLAALQNLALKPTESLLVQPLSPVDIIRSAMILRETIPYLEANAERIRNQLQNIENKKKKIETQIGEISKQKIVMQTERKRMIALVQRKSQLGNSVEIKSQKAKENMDKLASQAKNLRDLLNKIEQQRKERAAREAAERKRREAESRKLEEKQSDDLIKSERESITNIASGFAKAKGTLPMPARGTIISHYGEQKNGVSSKGLIVATRARAQVIAPFDGAVVFAGPFRGYGNMIIVEHDNGYLSLLSGLGSIDVELGQMLLAGEPVGQMPSGDKAELYIEIRKDNQPINPAAWFKI
jgi:septal ring factor EnvC (AmiA/AmiB activator)